MWDEFLADAMNYLKSQQQRLEKEFRLGHWERWFYDQKSGTITFSSAGEAGVIADMQVVGSTSNSSGTWLWSWDNPSILPDVKNKILEVRAYGAEHGFERLTDPKWLGDEYDGWEMTAVTAFILKADGGYRAPGDNGALFLVMENVRLA